MTLKNLPQGNPPIFPSLLWVLLCLVMWFWAIIGPVYFAAGAASYFVDTRAYLTMPFWDALALGAVLGTVGTSFVWLRWRRYIRFGPE